MLLHYAALFTSSWLIEATLLLNRDPVVKVLSFTDEPNIDTTEGGITTRSMCVPVPDCSMSPLSKS